MGFRSKLKPGHYSFEDQLALYTAVAGLIPTITLIWTLWIHGVSRYLIALAALVLTCLIAWVVATVRTRLLYQFRSMSNHLQAMVTGDYSLRVHTIGRNGAHLELVDAINDLSDTLTGERLAAVESQLLVGMIIDQIDVAILALDSEQNITLANPAGRRLLGLDTEEISADKGIRLPGELSLLTSLGNGESRIIELAFTARKGRFQVHKEQFREKGLSHELIFVTDVRTMLRAEERKAWQNLIRVIGHEINNSLTPISSISESLTQRVSSAVQQNQIEPDLGERIEKNLALVGERCTSLADFTERYRKLAGLPEPQLKRTCLSSLLERVVALVEEMGQTNVPITVSGDSALNVDLDPGLMEQVLINLLKNALEASGDHEGIAAVMIAWQASGGQVRITIKDEGHGLSNPDNLFVPFYSTKPNGSGIGLVLSRQIIEAHGGYLSLTNRENHQGCCASIELPMSSD